MTFYDMQSKPNKKSGNPDIHKNFQHLVILWASHFVLPSVSVGVGETIREEEMPGWHPISSISLQQSFWVWQTSSQ